MIPPFALIATWNRKSIAQMAIKYLISEEVKNRII
jgi:hypothetical protein